MKHQAHKLQDRMTCYLNQRRKGSEPPQGMKGEKLQKKVSYDIK